jgi:hypothetical protein
MSFRVHEYLFDPKTHKPLGNNKKPNPYFLFFEDYRKRENAPKRMADASKEASRLWKKMSKEERAHWRRTYELIRDKEVIHNFSENSENIDGDRFDRLEQQKQKQTRGRKGTRSRLESRKVRNPVKNDVFMGHQQYEQLDSLDNFLVQNL